MVKRSRVERARAEIAALLGVDSVSDSDSDELCPREPPAPEICVQFGIEKIWAWNPVELSLFASPVAEDKSRAVQTEKREEELPNGTHDREIADDVICGAPHVPLVIEKIEKITHDDARANASVKVSGTIPPTARRDNTKLILRAGFLIAPDLITHNGLRFTLPDLQPGSYDVLVECDGQSTGIWYTIDIEARATETTRCETQERFEILDFGAADARAGDMLVVKCKNIPPGARIGAGNSCLSEGRRNCKIKDTSVVFDLSVSKPQEKLSVSVPPKKIDFSRGFLYCIVPKGLQTGFYYVTVEACEETSICASKLNVTGTF